MASFNDRPEIKYNDVVLPFEVAKKLIWGAGNIALVNGWTQSDEYHDHMGELITRLFDKVDLVEYQAAVLEGALPAGQTIGVNLGELLSEINVVEDPDAAINGQEVNPFMVSDSLVNARHALALYVEAVYNSPTEN